MKTYEPRRNNQCPAEIHADYDPAKDPTQNECTCPWLIISSSTPVQHLTSWSRRELENVIRETDRGYFDPPGYPLRSNSMFLSPNMQRLVDMAEKEPVAAALTLLAGAAAHGDSGLPPFDAIAWDAEDACLSIRVGNEGGWRLLWLGHSNVDAVTNQNDAYAGGANPVLLWADHSDTARETALPKMNAAWHHEGCTCDLNDPRQQAGCQRADEFSADYFPDPISGQPEQLILGEDGSIPGFDSGYIGPPLQSVPIPAGDDVPPPLTPLIREVPAADMDGMKPGNPIFDEWMAEARKRGGNAGLLLIPQELTFPSDIAEASAQILPQVLDYAGTFVCTLPSGHGNNHSDGGRTWYDSGTDDCTCASRGSAPDTYRCPEHPACTTCGQPLVYDTMIGDAPTHTCRPALY